MRSITRTIAIVLIVLGSAGVLSSFMFPSDRQRLMWSGAEAKGRITEKWVGEPKQRGTYRRSHNLIAYEFTTAAGEQVRSEYSLWTRSQLDAIKPGKPITVLYLPDAPSLHEITEYRDEMAAMRNRWGRLAFCIVLLLIGGGMLVAMNRKPEEEPSLATPDPNVQPAPFIKPRRTETGGAPARTARRPGTQGFGNKARARA